MRGLGEMAATVVAGVAILAVVAYLLFGGEPAPTVAEAPAPDAAASAPAAAGDAVPPAASVAPAAPSPPAAPAAVARSAAPPSAASPGIAAPSRVLIPVDPATGQPRTAPATAAPTPEGYVAVEDVLAPARDVGGGFVTGAAPVAVGPIVRLQKAPVVKEVVPVPAPVKPRRFFRVLVDDAGTLVAGRRTLRLADVDVPAADAECGDAAGHRWSCGTRARTALRRLVRYRAVDCLPLGEVGFDSAEDALYVVRCRAGKTDLSTWLVENGWASPADEASPDLAALGETARAENRGLWQTEPKGLDDEDAEDAADAAAATGAVGSDAAAPADAVPDDPREATPGQ
jgi:endonuclease YncB( thermonuclease family)